MRARKSLIEAKIRKGTVMKKRRIKRPLSKNF
ncbi:hypothetical protein Goari_011579, partial [Gossypium aridum]|nr:hypothetical protein [Gossypium aridum]